VIRISGHRRDWWKENKKEKWKMKKEGTKEVGIKRQSEENKKKGSEMSGGQYEMVKRPNWGQAEK